MPVRHYRSLRRCLHVAIRALRLSATGRMQRPEVWGGRLLRLLLRLLPGLLVQVVVVLLLPLRICIRMLRR